MRGFYLATLRLRESEHALRDGGMCWRGGAQPVVQTDAQEVSLPLKRREVAPDAPE